MAFEYRCDMFSDGKLSIHFDNDKTKSIFSQVSDELKNS